MDFGERLEFFLPSQPIVCHNTIRQNGLQRATFRERHFRSPELDNAKDAKEIILTQRTLWTQRV